MIVVFTGPTLSCKEVAKHLDCICLPPVQHGDILQILSDNPTSIGIIDGYFEGTPSVWHKEILYALDQGVAVYGSASMGALRAAELCSFGMVGVGQIFNSYQEGTLTDDDEVAVLHGPIDVGFIAASEPMVNIRATLELACEQKIITGEQGYLLVHKSKQTFYKLRNWSRVLDDSFQLFNNKELTERLRGWLAQNQINLKKQDAFEMLKKMRTDSKNAQQNGATFDHFEWTHAWDIAFRRNSTAKIDFTLTDNDKLVLVQLSLDPDQYECYRDKAMLYHVLTSSPETVIDDSAIKKRLNRFRHQNALRTHNQLNNYLSKVSLDKSKLANLLKYSACLEQLRKTNVDLHADIVSQLKLDNRYSHYLDLANEKINLARTQEDDFVIDGFRQKVILNWYFQTRLGRPVPDRLVDFLENTAFKNNQEFFQAIYLDYLYRVKQTPHLDIE
jgi:hypothetical protein